MVDSQSAASRRSALPGPGRKEFEPGRIIVEIEESATRADLDELNRRDDVHTEEDPPRSDVNVVDLPQGVPVREP